MLPISSATISHRIPFVQIPSELFFSFWTTNFLVSVIKNTYSHYSGIFMYFAICILKNTISCTMNAKAVYRISCIFVLS